MRFRCILEQSGKTATGVEVPTEVLTHLGSGKRPAVRVTINGYTYRSSVGSMGGRSLLPVSAETRQQARISAGDEVEVEIQLDTAPREIVVPSDLAAALRENPSAHRAFDALNYSAKRRIVEPIEQAKTAVTRERRIAKSVEDLLLPQP